MEESGYDEKIDEIAEARRALARKNEATYQAQLLAIKEQVRETEGPGMINHMELQIRQWFLEYRDATGSFPDYPTEEDGGSESLFEKKNPQELAMELDKLRKIREKAEAIAAEEAKLAAEGGKNKKDSGKGQGKSGKDAKGRKDAKEKKKKGKDAKKGEKDAKGGKEMDKKGKGMSQEATKLTVAE